MKYIFALCEGMADFRPDGALKTAKKPLLDDLAGRGILGSADAAAVKMPEKLKGAESIPELMDALKQDRVGALHVSLPAGEEKAQAVEALDKGILAPVVCALEDEGEDFRLLVLAGGEKQGAYLLYDSRFDMHTKLEFVPEDILAGTHKGTDTDFLEVLQGK